MIESMTGFGTAKMSGGASSWSATVRSVNGRFLEVRCSLPRELAPMEAEIRQVVSDILGRGSVEIILHRTSTGSKATRSKLDSQAIGRWLKEIGRVSRQHKLPGAPSLEMILGLPEVIVEEEFAEILAKDKRRILTLIEEAARLCQSERQREGQRLMSEMSKFIKQISLLVKEIDLQASKGRQVARRRLEEKIEGLKLKFLEPQRLHQEVVLTLEKTDIQEEVDRLNTHLGHCQDLLKNNGRVGKKLDFYSQELLREINTIGSKSVAAEVTNLVVEAKTLVERIKEQVQNIA